MTDQKQCVICKQPLLPKRKGESDAVYEKRQTHKECRSEWMRRQRKGFFARWGKTNDL